MDVINLSIDLDLTCEDTMLVFNQNETPLTIMQGQDAVWLGKEQARELRDELDEALKPGGALA